MPLAPIALPVGRRPDRFISLKRLAAPALLALVLVGCGTGSADESRLYQERELDSTQESQVVAAQETVNAQFFSGTPTAGATSTPQPVLSSLRIATSVSGSGEPTNEVTSASAGGTIYVSARIHDVTAGSVYYAILGRKDGTAITQAEITVDRSASNAWLSFPFAINGTLGGGEYAAFIYIDGVLLGSIVFDLY
jgi:hypothetical protein